MKLNCIEKKTSNRTSGVKLLPHLKGSRTILGQNHQTICLHFAIIQHNSVLFFILSKHSLSLWLRSILPANTQKSKGGVFWKQNSARDEVISTRDNIRAQPCDGTTLILRKGLINNICALNKSIFLLTKHSGCRMLLFLIQLVPDV